MADEGLIEKTSSTSRVYQNADEVIVDYLKDIRDEMRKQTALLQELADEANRPKF